ncbi:D-TA family PLP-dependent enzyme [Schlesneria paludicola]|uniref:D-TA family PLP-dependent enzyme n=1 Tax=Schlesneria paludicola TaxID=360056 RepID=UPI00029B070C|nr:D-TA family PLP-dependent enzyme [Schlesneria paludicola]
MEPVYAIADTSQIYSPALLVYRSIVIENLKKMIAIAGSPQRLRPHCKTHKMPAVTKIELEMGITKHKCATFAEAEMLATAGAKDIFLAYNLVGPNITRAVRFLQKFSDVRFIVTADDSHMISELDDAMSAAGLKIHVALDLDSGMHRTGITPGPRAAELYQQIVDSPALVPAGFHFYDGHNAQTDLKERTAAVHAGWEKASRLRDEFVGRGWPVPAILCGGTGSFPIFAKIADPVIELAPGTCVFHDFGYDTIFPDMDFKPAVVMLTRVVSRPASDRVTCDLGSKSVASDPPKGTRVMFPDLPDAQQVIHNEEHLVLQTPLAGNFQPGDELYAIPKHVCPTSALYKQAYVIDDGKVVEMWDVTGRDRLITI